MSSSLELSNLKLIRGDGHWGLSLEASAQQSTAPPEPLDMIKDFEKCYWPKIGRRKEVKEIRIFIKCPHDSRPFDEAQQFVDEEFSSGPSINHASSRAEKRRGEFENPETFRLVKMIGKGRLKEAGSVRLRPCLVYELVTREKDSDSSASPPCKTFMDFSPVKEGIAKGKKLSDFFLKFAYCFSNTVRVLHNQGIVHTFLVPRNLVRYGKNPLHWTIVSFGYARHSDSANSPDRNRMREGESSHDRWYRAPECRDHDSAAAPHVVFGYSADIYSVGAILLTLLLDGSQNRERALQDILGRPPRDNRVLKERIRSAFREGEGDWETIRANENVLKILDSCLRYKPSDRFSCAEDLLEAIGIAAADFSMGDALPKVDVLRKKPVRRSSKLEFFEAFCDSLAISYDNGLESIGQGHFEVYASRDRIVTSLCRLLMHACKTAPKMKNGADKPALGEPKWHYRTVTLPDYWTDENLGSYGRFLVMNKHCARSGVQIERIFIVDQPFQLLPEEQQRVLEAHYRAWLDLKEDELEKNFKIKVLEDKKASIDFERDGNLVAFLASQPSPKSEDALCLNFFSLATALRQNGRVSISRKIHKIRYWNPAKVERGDQFQDNVRRFNRAWDEAEPLDYYVRKTSYWRPTTGKREGNPADYGKVNLSELITAKPPASR